MSWKRRPIPCVLIAWMILASGALAWAHKGAGEGPPDAATWVRQALAFLELKPPDVREAAERLEGALKAKEPRGVDLALVREAVEALKARKPESAAAALARALLPPPEASPGGPPSGPPPYDPDEEASAHHVPGAPLKALEPRFAGTAGEYALLGLGGVLMALGLLTLRRASSSGAEGLR